MRVHVEVSKLVKYVLLLVLLAVLIVSVYSTTIHPPTTSHLYFGFQGYGTYVDFTSQPTFTTINRTSNYWYFNNFGVQEYQGNATLTDFFQTGSNNLGLTITAPTGTVSTSKFYTGTKGEPTELNVSDPLARWTYDSTSKIFTVNATHASPVYLGITWTPVSTVSVGTFYMRNETHTVNYVSCSELNESQGNLPSTALLSAVGDLETYYGYRVYVMHYDGNVTELSSGSPVALTWRVVDGEGLQNATWHCPATGLDVGFDALEVDLYQRTGPGAWIKQTEFVTDPLFDSKLNESVWMFSTFTNRTVSGPNTLSYVFYGDSTVNTAVYGVALKPASIYDMINHSYKVGDFIGAILLPFTNLVGNVFYGMLMLLICVPLYRRYQSFTPILLIFLIGGGIGGFVGMMIPQVASGVAWIFFVLGLAGLIYKVVR